MDQERFRQAVDLLTGMTQEELAARLDCSTRLIRKICDGGGGVTDEKAAAIQREVEDMADRIREWLGSGW